MKKETVFIAVMLMATILNNTFAGISIVVNGSFENDGRRISTITEDDTPQRWSDVNLPTKKFGAWVENDWSSYFDNGYSLTIFTTGFEEPSHPSFADGQIGSLSQWVELNDVNEIIFDLKLGTNYSSINWDPSERTAIIMIGNDVVWESNSLSPNPFGEYEFYDLTYKVEPQYQVPGRQKLSVGIRSEVDGIAIYQYWSQWDFIRFNTHCDCGGYDYPAGDISRNCYVDEFDLRMLVAEWLYEPSAQIYDLYEDADNIVNSRDYAVLAWDWMSEDFGLDSPLIDIDLDNDGIVNFHDYAIAIADWDGQDYDDVKEIADIWLEKSWIYGLD